jgi:hypothetical protein
MKNYEVDHVVLCPWYFSNHLFRMKSATGDGFGKSYHSLSAGLNLAIALASQE